MHRLFLILLGFSLFIPAPRAEPVVEENITRALEKAFPDMEVTRINESRIPGLYEIMLGPEVIYISRDGKYLLKGDLYDLGKRENLSEREREVARVEILSKIPENEYIEFAPNNVEHSIYVFTDVTCGYCRRLHNDVPELNSKGIAVKYLAYPRNGMDTPASREMEFVWCAKDPNKALTAAKRGQPVKPAKCDNPVAKHFALGQAMGIRGTPAIYLENGKELPGYIPPQELLQIIQQN